MRPLIFFIAFVSLTTNVFSQTDSVLKFIFIPHPRSEDQIHQSVYSSIERINFSQYDVIMLGGDITYSTSKDSATLAYCENLFHISNPNTLWSFGNHDVQSGHRDLIKRFTERESYYTYTRDGITFIVLDTELNANGFSSTFILNDQLQLVNDVCDTLSTSKYLILLHSRYLWMINNADLKPRLTDSIAASSRSMDTTNFYADIYPMLQKVKQKGIQVLVFGGDKSKINIEYSPEDSITFYAARLAVDLPDSINNVIVLDFNKSDNTLSCTYTPLDNLVTGVSEKYSQLPSRFVLYQNYPNPFNPATFISYQLPVNSNVVLRVYDLLGRVVETLVNTQQSAGNYNVTWNASGFSGGVYFYRLQTEAFSETKKLVVVK